MPALRAVVLAIGSVWLATQALAAGPADDRAQAAICRKMLDVVAAGRPEEAANIMLQQGQPSKVGVSQEGDSNLQAMRVVFRHAYEGLLRQSSGGLVKGRERMPDQKEGQRIIVIERWIFGDSYKPYAGCVRFPHKSGSWMTDVQFGRDRAVITEKLRASAKGEQR
jgi:hypothetical protein